MQFCFRLCDLGLNRLGVLIPERRMFPPRNRAMALKNWKLSLSLAILGLLMPLSHGKRRGSPAVGEKWGCCCAIELRRRGSEPGDSWSHLEPPFQSSSSVETGNPTQRGWVRAQLFWDEDLGLSTCWDAVEGKGNINAIMEEGSLSSALASWRATEREDSSRTYFIDSFFSNRSPTTPFPTTLHEEHRGS